jgi:hypothetical protein
MSFDPKRKENDRLFQFCPQGDNVSAEYRLPKFGKISVFSAA